MRGRAELIGGWGWGWGARVGLLTVAIDRVAHNHTLTDPNTGVALFESAEIIVRGSMPVYLLLIPALADCSFRLTSPVMTETTTTSTQHPNS